MGVLRANAPHKLQGRGASHWSMGLRCRWCQPLHKPMAAPCQLHAVVSPQHDVARSRGPMRSDGRSPNALEAPSWAGHPRNSPARARDASRHTPRVRPSKRRLARLLGDYSSRVLPRGTWKPHGSRYRVEAGAVEVVGRRPDRGPSDGAPRGRPEPNRLRLEPRGSSSQNPNPNEATQARGADSQGYRPEVPRE